MANKEDERGCVTFTWEIQNFGLFLSLEEECCSTPFWRTEHTGKSIWWRLKTYFMGSTMYFELRPFTGFLHLDNFEVSLTYFCREVPLYLYFAGAFCWCYTVERDVVFGEKRHSILPNDTLTLRCKMWEKSTRNREFHINSVLHRFNYLWNIENFNSNYNNEEYIMKENFLFKMSLTSKSKKGTHSLLFGEVSSKEYDIFPINCKISVKTGRVQVIREISDDDYNNKTYEIEICLNNTRLDLQLESVFEVHKVCRNNPFKLPSQPRYENVSEAGSGALGDDLLLLYRNKLFSDVTLNANGQSFPVHRNVLSARSPVFRAMFEKDELSEGRSGVVNIDDVDSDTVDRMLVFLYGDSLRSVQQFEDASALYYAADKYDIQPLKHKCASSLKEGLTVHNACDALVLADRHSDDQLMKCIVDFLRQNEEVISSKKWDSFQISNPLLSSKILREMYLKVKKK